MKRLLTALTLSTAALTASAAVAPISPAGGQEDSLDDRAIITPGRLIDDRLSEPGAPPALRPLTGNDAIGRAPVTPLDVGSSLRFCFDATVPPAVQAAAARAGAVWDSTLDVRGPVIEVAVSWSPFASTQSLGLAGPGSFVEHPDLPVPSHRYPVALANELLDNDFAPGSAACDTSMPAEIVLRLNSTASGPDGSWHLGPEAPPAGTIDLTSLIIHEIAHGLGFTGSAERNDNDILTWPEDGRAPYIYDLFASRCARVVLESCGPGQMVGVNTGDLAALTANALWFRAGQTNLKLHAPSAWDTGSSFSHLDEAHYQPGSGASLMTPFLEPGEQHLGVDQATTAVLQQIGWRLATPPTTTDRIGLTPIDGGIQVSFGQLRFDEGPAPVAYVVTIQVPVDGNAGEAGAHAEPFAPITITDQAFAITGLTNGQTYRLAVQGRSPAGVGPTFVTAHFVAGENQQATAARQLATQVLLDLRDDLPGGDETLRLTNDILGVGPGPAVAARIETQEFDAHASIVRLYLGFLGRVPDDIGIEFWISQHRQGRHGAGQDLTTVATRFAEASQFELGAQLNDQEFVTRVYDTILGRQPEQAGLDFWVGRLEDGMPRGRLLLEVSESIEHRISSGPASQVIATYIGLLDRLPTARELQEGESLVASGRLEQFVGQLVTGQEYQGRIAR